jgi:murein DD-endopeptidase MepM/ murein hydrolase activator NlpD
VREGQFLLIPQNGSSAPAPVPVVEPGQGSVTPVPPSAAAPLPDETPSVPAAAPAVPHAPDIGTAAPAPAASNAVLIYPVQGDIIRAYSPGRNEGIDIGAAPGASVKAAAAGEVAAVTTDTSGVPIVVIKHPDNLLTVYTNLEGLSVAKGDSVTRGQQIARVRDADPSFLHFEVRRGLQSVDPADFLP